MMVPIRKNRSSKKLYNNILALGSHSHILMMGWGGGGNPSDFWGSEILAKSDFLWFYERHRDFFGLQKNRGIFWVAKKGLRDFFE